MNPHPVSDTSASVVGVLYGVFRFITPATSDMLMRVGEACFTGVMVWLSVKAVSSLYARWFEKKKVP